MKYGSTISKLKSKCGPYAAKVAFYTRMSEDQLAEEILLAGLEYISFYESLSRILAYSKAFWSWFKMTWYSHDAMYFGCTSESIRSKEHYLKFHNKQLKLCSMPDALIEELTKNLKNNNDVPA